MTIDPPVSVPAGWYPDPSDPRVLRLWDGADWTTHVAFPEAGGTDLSATAMSPISSSVVAPPAGRWGWGDVFWTILVVVGMTIAGVILFVGVAALHPSSLQGGTLAYSDPLVAWMLVVAQGLSMLGLAGWPIIAGHWKGDGWRKSFGFVVNGRAWLIGGAGGIGAFLALLILTALTSIVIGQQVDSAAADVVTGMANVTGAYWVFMVFIAIGAPFVEEISFRGLLWGAMVKKGWSPWVATSISAVAFGLFHFEPLRLVALIAAGFVLGAVRHYAGLGASMFSHAIVNTIGVIAMLLTT